MTQLWARTIRAPCQIVSSCFILTTGAQPGTTIFRINMRLLSTSMRISTSALSNSSLADLRSLDCCKSHCGREDRRAAQRGIGHAPLWLMRNNMLSVHVSQTHDVRLRRTYPVQQEGFPGRICMYARFREWGAAILRYTHSGAAPARDARSMGSPHYALEKGRHTGQTSVPCSGTTIFVPQNCISVPSTEPAQWKRRGPLQHWGTTLHEGVSSATQHAPNGLLCRLGSVCYMLMRGRAIAQWSRD